MITCNFQKFNDCMEKDDQPFLFGRGLDSAARKLACSHVLASMNMKQGLATASENHKDGMVTASVSAALISGAALCGAAFITSRGPSRS